MVVALFFWAFIQSFLLGITVLIYRNNQPNRVLATFFFLISTIILFQYLLKYELWLFDLPITLFIPDLVNISIGPILFLYSQLLINKPWKKSNWLHFIPLILMAGYFLFFEYLPEYEFTYVNYIDTASHVAILSFILLSNCIYLFLFWQNYLRGREMVKRGICFIKPWFQTLILFFSLQLFINVVIWILHFNLFKLNVDSIASVNTIKDLIFITLNTIIVLTTSFFIITNPEVITSLGTKISNRLKSKPFVIDEKNAARLIAELKVLMEEKKIFLNPQLNEKMMANELNIQSYYLSKLMNEHVNCSFVEYINKARIDEAKRLLESKQHQGLTIYAIAIDSGFSSESVFYSNFKKYAGMTPIQYKKIVLKNKLNQNPENK
jgi:AraC-like DNA-binding protein